MSFCIYGVEGEGESKSAHSGLRWWSNLSLPTAITSAKHLGDFFQVPLKDEALSATWMSRLWYGIFARVLIILISCFGC